MLKYHEIILKRENNQDEKAQQIKDKICKELESLFRKNNESPRRLPATADNTLFVAHSAHPNARYHSRFTSTRNFRRHKS
jgi:hypothetical protein